MPPSALGPMQWLYYTMIQIAVPPTCATSTLCILNSASCSGSHWLHWGALRVSAPIRRSCCGDWAALTPLVDSSFWTLLAVSSPSGSAKMMFASNPECIRPHSSCHWKERHLSDAAMRYQDSKLKSLEDSWSTWSTRGVACRWMKCPAESGSNLGSNPAVDVDWIDSCDWLRSHSFGERPSSSPVRCLISDYSPCS